MYLTCSCGNKDFVHIHKLRTSQAGSVVTEVAGSRCTACGKNADFARLMREADLRSRRQELTELQKEIEQAENTGATLQAPIDPKRPVVS